MSTQTKGLRAVEEMSFAEALCAAQADAMEADETIVLMGQDIQAGFPFGATKGLVGRFGKQRVINTPISEAATMGCGVGAALGGLRPVVEVDFSGFLLLGLDQLVNNGAKLRYMSGDQVRIPLVVRVGQGPLGSFAAQHSQTQHAFLASIPGLVVLVPATPQAAYDCVRWALVQNDPVVVLEDMRLYRTRGEVRHGDAPSGCSSRILRDGDALTIVTYGFGASLALEAADVLAGDGIDTEVLVLESLAPLDIAAISHSARRTRRVLCLGDDPPLFGVTSTLANIVNTEAYDVLAAPVLSLGSRPVPTPYSPPMERLVFPSAEGVVDAARRLVGWED